MSSETHGSENHHSDRPVSRSRQGWFPSPSISYLVARIESRRSWRKVRNQDLWLALAGIGILFVLVSLPIMYSFGASFGEELNADSAPIDIAFTIVIGTWITMVAFGIMAGTGSEGEVDNQAAILTVRPPKDVAGGLLLGTVVGYAPLLCLPALAGGIGIAVGVGTPAPIAGILAGSILLLVTGVTIGYACGLTIKGIVRRSARLTQLKPAIGVAIFVGYIWLSATGRLFTIVIDAGELLRSSPLGWLADLTFLTTPNAGASVLNAIGALAVSAAVVPVGVFAVVRAAEYAWYAEQRQRDSDDEPVESSGRDSTSLGERFDAALGVVGVSAGARGVTTTVLVRAYRSPLQLVYVVVPLFLLLPTIETAVSSGFVPEWLPWGVLLYGGWVAGAAFPLNLLGDQGATLPTVLTARIRGRQVVHGYVLAAVLIFVLPTAVAAIATAQVAGRSTETLLSVGLASPLAVIAGAVLAAGFGAAFPRFQSIDLTGSTKALLPSKTAFTLFSMTATFSITAIGVLIDDIYRIVTSDLLTTWLPYGITVSPGRLETASQIVTGLVVVAVPLAYLFASRRIDSYRLE